jgi:hypothetical protein
MSISEICEKLLSICKKQLNVFDDYYDVMLSVSDTSQSVEIKKIHTLLQTQHEKLLQINISANHIEFYRDISSLNEGIHAVYYLFEKPQMYIVDVSNSDISGTAKLDLTSNFEDVTTKLYHFDRNFDDLEQQLIEVISTEVDIDGPNFLNDFHTYFVTNRNIIKLYLYILNKLIDSATSVDVLEKLRTYLLQDRTQCFTSLGTEISASQLKIRQTYPSVQKFGLIPVSEYFHIKNLSNVIDSLSPDITTIAKLKKFAETSKISFVILTHAVGAPVCYNLSKLFLPSTHKKEHAIDEYTIERTKTITLEPDSKHSGNKCVMYLHTSDGDKFVGYVLETTDSVSYRVLGKWQNKTNGKISSSDITDIVQYYRGKKTIIDPYQSLCIASAAKNMFVNKQPDMKYFEIYSKEIDLTSIRNQLFLQLNTVIRALIGETKIQSSSDINSIIHDKKINETFVNSILKLYKIGANVYHIDEYSAGKFPFSEILSTFLAELQTISLRFGKELHDNLNRTIGEFDASNPDLYKPGNEAQTQHLVTKKLEKILVETINMIMNIDSNIFSSLNYKYLLLNYTDIGN